MTENTIVLPTSLRPMRSGALPPDATDAAPGTERKIQVMTERAARREQIFHPMDGLIQKPHSKIVLLDEAG